MTCRLSMQEPRTVSSAALKFAINSYTVGLSFAIPTPEVMFPWESKSTSSTFFPASAMYAPRLMTEVVLPTPPFWFTKTNTFPMARHCIMFCQKSIYRKQ